MPQPTPERGRLEEPPQGPGVEIGTAYLYRLYVHCGIRDARFDGRLWMANPMLSDGSGNPPLDWTPDDSVGVMELVNDDLAVFTAESGPNHPVQTLALGCRMETMAIRTEVMAYPDLPPPALPASVKAWRDAVVRVDVERASRRPRVQQGLIVADGAVLTVLDLMEEVASLSVTVSGRGVFAAELVRFDPRTGAALLSVGAEGLVVAPGDSGRVAHGEPVLLLSRDEDGGELVVKETHSSPNLNADGPSLRAVQGLHTLLPTGHCGGGRRWHTHRSCEPLLGQARFG